MVDSIIYWARLIFVFDSLLFFRLFFFFLVIVLNAALSLCALMALITFVHFHHKFFKSVSHLYVQYDIELRHKYIYIFWGQIPGEFDVTLCPYKQSMLLLLLIMITITDIILLNCCWYRCIIVNDPTHLLDNISHEK